MQRISNWSAVRSGASLTVTGKNPDGSPAKLTRIERIDRIDSAADGGSVAVRGDERFPLA